MSGVETVEAAAPAPNTGRPAPVRSGGGRAVRLACLAVLGFLVARHAVQVHARAAAAWEREVTAARTEARRAAPLQMVRQATSLPAHSTFPAFLVGEGFDDATRAAVLRTVQPLFNLGHVRAGNLVVLVRTRAGELRLLRYRIDGDRELLVLHDGLGYHASVEQLEYVTRIEGVAGRVEGSLFGAVSAAGEKDTLALALAQIFGFDLDFYTDPRPGDIFRVVVEKRYLGGQLAGYGRILAAEYVNAGHAYDAVRFHDAGDEATYYQPDGHPLKRAFLSSPLKFAARVSSGFTEHRYHPILKKYRPHLGVDYAAPMGTPVQAIGSGTVVSAGWSGGGGNMVRLDHHNGYQTLYLHLSRLLVHRGQHVAQGQRVGLVGMTGLATGPHLDFRIALHGRFENFEVLRRKLPSADPLGGAPRMQFVRLRDRLLPELARLQPAR